MATGGAAPIQTEDRAGSASVQLGLHGETQVVSSDTSLAVVLSYDHSLLRLVRRLLEELGLEAYNQEPCDETVQTVARLRPSVVILDVDFVHEEPTWAVLRALEENPSTYDIPVIVCAAAPWVLAGHKPLLQSNTIRTWTEPYDPLELLRSIDAAVSEQSAADPFRSAS